MLRVLFFQAEDGIRYYKVTGVQTCALPICLPYLATTAVARAFGLALPPPEGTPALLGACVFGLRSEERRVGEEGRFRWSADHFKKKYTRTECIWTSRCLD